MANHSEWLSRGRKLARAHQSSNWELGDWAVEGEQYFGTKTVSYDAAQKVTGISRGILYRHAMLARHYPPALRFSSIPFLTYYQLTPFPIEFTSRFLPTVADKDLTSGQILARATAAFGSDPAPRRKRPAKFHPVRIYTGLYNALAERAPDKTAVPAFIQTILEEYLVGEKTERQPTSNAKTAAWRAAVQNAGKDSRRDGPSVGNDVPSATTPLAPIVPEKRPTSKRKACTCKIRVQWGDACNPNLKKALQPECFASEDVTVAANEQFEKCHGYKEQVVYCDKCRAWHLKHVYSGRTLQDVLASQFSGATA